MFERKYRYLLRQLNFLIDRSKNQKKKSPKLALDPANYEMCSKEMLDMLRHFVK